LIKDAAKTAKANTKPDHREHLDDKDSELKALKLPRGKPKFYDTMERKRRQTVARDDGLLKRDMDLCKGENRTDKKKYPKEKESLF